MTIRYIKLGSSGRWEKRCIEEDQTIRLGYHSKLHQQCLDGEWETLHSHWKVRRNGDQGAATRDVNQIRDFYEAPETDIWVTFYKRHLYWCEVEGEVIEDGDEGDRFRRVKGKWSCMGKRNRQPLAIENLDGRITKTQGFRGTICAIALEMEDYLLKKVEGIDQRDVKDARAAADALTKSIQKLIRGLWWKDFELLVDLIFSKLGWQRVSLLGKTEKDIDLDVRSPITKKRACVQVKSSTTVDEISKCFRNLGEYAQYDEKYFVYHTLDGKPEDVERDDERYILWDDARVADLVVQAGLIDWLILKRS